MERPLSPFPASDSLAWVYCLSYRQSLLACVRTIQHRHLGCPSVVSGANELLKAGVKQATIEKFMTLSLDWIRYPERFNADFNQTLRTSQRWLPIVELVHRRLPNRSLICRPNQNLLADWSCYIVFFEIFGLALLCETSHVLDLPFLAGKSAALLAVENDEILAVQDYF
jgi:hypothetical protein